MHIRNKTNNNFVVPHKQTFNIGDEILARKLFDDNYKGCFKGQRNAVCGFIDAILMAKTRNCVVFLRK